MNSEIQKFLEKKEQKVEKYKDLILSMLADEEAYGFAESTLAGILDYIENTGQITHQQILAVDNIYKSTPW